MAPQRRKRSECCALRCLTGGCQQSSLSCPSLSAVVAAVGSDLHDLQNQIEQVSSLKDALMCISDVAQIVEILLRFLEQMLSWAAKRGLDTAEGFCGPPAPSRSSPSAMAGQSTVEPILCHMAL